MKKLIFILSFFLLSFVGLTQPIHLKATALSLKLPEETEWSAWAPVSIFTTIDLERKEIWILSEKPQKFNCLKFHSVEYEKGFVIGSFAHDNDKLKCYVELFLHDNGNIMIVIEYNNIEYAYMLEEYNE